MKTEKDIAKFLRELITNHDPDWIVYQLTEGAVAKRNEVDEGDNKAEKAYWQKVVVAFNEFQSKLESI